MSRYHRETGARHWEGIRERVLARDGRRCRDCGKAGRLEVHHVRHLQDGGDNSMGNLRTLCRDCHIRAHQGPESPERADWRDLVAAIDTERGR